MNTRNTRYTLPHPPPPPHTHPRLREEQAARSTSLHDITTLTEQVQQLQRQLHSAHEKLNALAPCMKQRDQALGRVQELEQLYV